MSEEITAICGECDKQFNYILKPGFPRKYCPPCSAAKKAAYEDMQKPEIHVEKPVPVVKMNAKTKEVWTHLNCKIMCAKDLVIAGNTMKDSIEAIKLAKQEFE